MAETPGLVVTVKGLVLVLDDDTLRELVDTAAHGAFDRIRMGHPPSEDVQQAISMMTREYSLVDENAKSGNNGSLLRAAPEVLDRTAAARYAGRSPATIDRWRRSGLRSHNDGRAVLIRTEDLKEYMKNGQ